MIAKPDGSISMLYTNRVNFTLYRFNADVKTSTGLSSFDVEIKDNGISRVFNNGGNGFPFQDSVIYLADKSSAGITFEGDTRVYTISLTVAVSYAHREYLHILSRDTYTDLPND